MLGELAAPTRHAKGGGLVPPSHPLCSWAGGGGWMGWGWGGEGEWSPTPQMGTQTLRLQSETISEALSLLPQHPAPGLPPATLCPSLSRSPGSQGSVGATLGPLPRDTSHPPALGGLPQEQSLQCLNRVCVQQVPARVSAPPGPTGRLDAVEVSP